MLTKILTAITYHPPAFRQHLSAALAEARLRLIYASRYPRQLMMDIILPIIFAAMPILLGRATSRPQATANFVALPDSLL